MCIITPIEILVKLQMALSTPTIHLTPWESSHKQNNKIKASVKPRKHSCRSANYNNKTGECVLSNMDRITLAGTNSFQANEGTHN